MEISILISILTWIVWKKLNSPLRSVILRYKNQEYRLEFRNPGYSWQKNGKMKSTGHCKALCVSRKRNSHINCILERVLKIVYQDHNSTFNDLLAKDDCFKIHDRNLNKLLIEMFKLKMRLALEIMSLVFDIIECLYPLKNELRFKSRNIRNV